MLHGDKIYIEAEKLTEKQRGGKSMATSSIFRNIVLTEEKDVKLEITICDFKFFKKH